MGLLGLVITWPTPTWALPQMNADAPLASVMSPLVAMSPVMSPFESTPIESLPTIPASRKGWLPAAECAVTWTRRVAPSEVACETISRLSGPVVGRTQESKATPLTVPAL